MALIAEPSIKGEGREAVMAELSEGGAVCDELQI